MGGVQQQTTTTENAKVEASLNLRFAESGTKNYCSTPDSTKQKLTPLPPLLEFEVPSDGIEKNEQFVRWFLETKILDVMKHLTGNGDVN